MKEYIEYFTGLQRSYGVCKIEDGYIDQETGKKKWKHEWAKIPVTNEDYQDHIKGIKSIGIQPCTDEGMARFGAIDVDKYPIDRKFYLDIIQDKELPIIPILSKSGGLHLYVFTTRLVKAKDIRDFLEELLFAFKLPQGTEIFPKQTQLRSSDGTLSNGNFINLPYNGDDRKALDVDGTTMSFDKFVQTVKLNLVDPKNFKNIKEDIVSKELKGGGEEFNDGPPCLQKLTKEVMTFTDGRDRFLYNYMVFAKKKYPDNWEDKIIEAARKYFEFDSSWTDVHVSQKIKSWAKQKKGYTCNDSLLAPVCVKSVCVKRKFGVISDNKPRWPALTALQKLNIKPTPEWYFTVEDEKGQTKQIHAKNIHKIESQKELRALVMEQAHIVPPTIKANDFHEILKNLFEKHKLEIINPAEGTNPSDVLMDHINRYINEPEAKKHTSFKSGRPLLDSEYAYFSYAAFYDDMKTFEWKDSSAKTSLMIKSLFNSEKEDEQAKFDHSKRFPGKDAKGNSFPPLKTLRLPLKFLTLEKNVEERHNFVSEENII